MSGGTGTPHECLLNSWEALRQILLEGLPQLCAKRTRLALMPQALHSLGAHLVFSTRGRRPLISTEIRPDVHAFLAGTLRDLDCRSVTVGGTEDHVHLLFDMSKKIASAKLIEEVKRRSSKFVKTLDPGLAEFYWQGGYGMFGVSPHHFGIVREYVVNQERHHRQETFQDELRRLLTEAGVPFDERYLWD